MILNLVLGIYIGEATKDGGLILHLVKEADKITNPIDPSLPLPFSDSGFCSQAEVEEYYKQAVA
jgi:hypothetical protein